MSGRNKCRGCGLRIKEHKFGKWGPGCKGPDSGGGSDEEKSSVMQQLRLITDRLADLEIATGTGAAKDRRGAKCSSSSDEEAEPDLESMSKKQLLEHIKNSNNSRDELAKANADKKRGNKADVIDLSGKDRRKRGLSISNLFDTDYLRDQDQQNLQQAADKLKAKHRRTSKEEDNRIPGVGRIDDLRRDPRLAGAADDLLRDAGKRAPWLRTPAERDDIPRRDRGDGDWPSRDSVLLTRNRGNFSNIRGQKELEEYLVRNMLSANTIAYAGVAL